MNDGGFFLMWRKIRNNWVWDESRIFSNFEAFYDILSEVQFLDEEQTVSVDGVMLGVCHRGQSLKSYGTWAKRWNWSRSKVVRYLDKLAKTGMITKESIGKSVKIEVVNYEKYQNPAEEMRKKCGRDAEEMRKVCERKPEQIDTDSKRVSMVSPERHRNDTGTIAERCRNDSGTIAETDNKGKELNNEIKEMKETVFEAKASCPEPEKPAPKKPKTSKPDEIPENLQTPEFLGVWEEWKQHRREKKQTLTDTTKKKQLKSFSEVGPDVAIMAISDAIEKGYTGVFVKNFTGQNAAKTTKKPETPKGEPIKTEPLYNPFTDPNFGKGTVIPKNTIELKDGEYERL